MLKATFRPWHAWPGAATPSWQQRSRYSFKASWAGTLDLLERELRHLDAGDVVVQLALQERDIRNDGWPRERATPSSPGVILSFDHPEQGRVQYAVDRYEYWQHNLRAIALALGALRAVDRYGISSRGEQYAGWKALPASTEPTRSVAWAADLVASHTGVRPELLLRDVREAQAALRMAASRTHPDVGGDAREFAAVQEAKTILMAHHGPGL